MPDHGSEQSTGGVYLLFAHEAYYPAPSQEINTSLVAAASLLHPRVRQPDGTRIHERLTRGRRPGEIVPLSTLTDELDGPPGSARRRIGAGCAGRPGGRRCGPRRGPAGGGSVPVRRSGCYCSSALARRAVLKRR
ncbi:hypothetical protein GCM10010377_73220 [Streptomyces viridiviolaceus]|nr:hypothetical protein GCM10010377_73220 [Streptomyces viridiviolaceus]